MTIRKSFKFKGNVWNFVDCVDGWRYYDSKTTNFQIKCKGLKVEVVI